MNPFSGHHELRSYAGYLNSKPVFHGTVFIHLNPLAHFAKKETYAGKKKERKQTRPSRVSSARDPMLNPSCQRPVCPPGGKPAGGSVAHSLTEPTQICCGARKRAVLALPHCQLAGIRQRRDAASSAGAAARRSLSP